MQLLLLSATISAAILVPAMPAEAQALTSSGFTSFPASQVQQGRHGPSAGVIREGDRHGRRHHRRHNATDVVIGWGWNGDWAYFNNRTFKPDSYNDWWHDRPDRAYPHWMQANQNCARMWYGGDTLRC
jgi:hypothetical protein